MVGIVLWSAGDWRHSSDETKASGRAVVKKDVAARKEVREPLCAEVSPHLVAWRASRSHHQYVRWRLQSQLRISIGVQLPLRRPEYIEEAKESKGENR
jgi:hypothetical protein